MTAFRFDFLAAARPDDPYYATRWDRGVPITVVADVKQEAINKADAALGDAGRGRHWVFKTRSVTDARLPQEAK